MTEASRRHPTHVGRYELVEELDAPKQGRSFLARSQGETRSGHLFVVALLPADEAGAVVPELLARVKATRGVRHQNVLGLVDAGTSEHGVYVVTRYVEGRTLRELARRVDEVPARIALAIAIDALHGLHALHALDLVHGSVTPDALVVGGDGVCRLSELAAGALHDLAPVYRSPEQIATGQIDSRSDVYSLGVVLWNALTGKTLFEGETEQETLDSVLGRPVPRPSGVGWHPPAILDAVVMRALEREPERRFASADDMARSLRDLATKTACLAAPTEIADWVTSVCRVELEAQRRSIRASVPPAIGAATTPVPEQSASAHAPAAAPASHRGRIAAVGIGAFALAAAAVGWRYLSTAPAAAPVEHRLEATVVDIQPVAPPAPAAAAAAAAPVIEPEPEPAPAPPPSEPPQTTRPQVPDRPAKPARTNRTKRPTPAAAVPAPQVTPPPSDPVPATKPDPKNPPLEDNPYVYK